MRAIIGMSLIGGFIGGWIGFNHTGNTLFNLLAITCFIAFFGIPILEAQLRRK
jgi:hypothetical protein